jgi:YgiT-type zinc finger domain-containing protein
MFKCHVCGNTAPKSDFVSEVFTIDGRRVLVEHIPAQVCDGKLPADFARLLTVLKLPDTSPEKSERPRPAPLPIRVWPKRRDSEIRQHICPDVTHVR